MNIYLPLTGFFPDMTNRQFFTISASPVPQNKISVILGANGCGKSTLLKTFARLLKPSKGTITLDGKHISSLPSRQLAQTLGLLPQTPVTPEGIKVTDLVSRGVSLIAGPSAD